MTTKKNNLIVFTGPSGVGKGTVVKELFKNLDKIEFSISATTREKRTGEAEGVNYFYKSKEEFEQMIHEDRLLEWAEFVGNYYGTPRRFVDETLASGKDVFLEIEVQGALQVKEKFPEAVMIFLRPPSLQILEDRLRSRGTEDEITLQRRLSKARVEIQQTEFFDHVVINHEDQVSETADFLRNIILNEREVQAV